MQKAFTLAEVLVTLGVIGVVVAMTMPSLIAKYQKKVTATKLEQSYSILAQALKTAQADHGDMSGWGLDLKDGVPSASINRKDFLVSVVQTYIIPYLKSVKDYGYVNGLMNIGYSGSSQSSYFFVLPNGSLIETSLAIGCDDKGREEDGNCIGESIYTRLVFKVDVNGIKGPNKIGKDIFLAGIYSDKLQMYHFGSDRDAILRGCKSDGQSCGYLIQMDGWEIKNDYPR